MVASDPDGFDPRHMHNRHPSALRCLAVFMLGVGAAACTAPRYAMLPDDGLPLLAPCNATVEGRNPK